MAKLSKIKGKRRKVGVIEEAVDDLKGIKMSKK